MSEQEQGADPVDPEIAALEAELEAARQARAAATSARAEATKADNLRAAIAREKREAEDQAAIQAAEQKHGAIGVKIGLVRTRLGVLIVKHNPLLYKRFQDIEGKITREDIERLVHPSVVHPAPAERDKLLAELPDALNQAAVEIAALAGVRKDALSGKS